MPKRYQRKRTAGWRKADHCPDAVDVGRGSKWGNPYHVPSAGGSKLCNYHVRSKKEAVEAFRTDLLDDWLDITVEDVKRELKDKDLMCWCTEDAPWCHGDVLIEIANS